MLVSLSSPECRDARVAARLSTEVQKRRRKQFQAAFDANAATGTSSAASVGVDASSRMTTTDFVQGEGKTEYDALDGDHLASFAEEQFALGDAATAPRRPASKRSTTTSRRG